MEKIKLFEVGDEQIHLSPLKPLYANQSLRGGYYYSAADVDATLDDVRALVEAGLAIKDQLHENATKYCCPFPCSIIDDWNKATAAVERHLEGKTSSSEKTP